MESKKSKSILRNMFMFIILIFMSINTIHATQIYVADENNAFATIPDDAFTNRIYSKTFSVLQDNTTKDITGQIVVDNTQETFFTTQVLNEIGNNTMEFLFSATYFIGGSPEINTYSFNLTPGSQQALGVLTTVDDETLQISIRCTNGCDNETTNGFKVVAQTLDQNVDTVDDITSALIAGIKDFISINIGFWRTMYYLFIIGVILGSLGLLVGFGFKVFEWGERLSEKKKHIFEVREKK